MTTETLYALNVVRTYFPDKDNVNENTDTYDTDSKGNIIAVSSIDEVLTLAKKHITDILRFEYTYRRSDLVLSSFHDYTTEGLTANSVRLFELTFQHANDEGDEDCLSYLLMVAKVAYQKP